MVISVPRFYELLHTNIMAKINRSALLKAVFALARALGSRKFSLALFSSIHKKFGGEINSGFRAAPRSTAMCGRISTRSVSPCAKDTE